MVVTPNNPKSCLQTYQPSGMKSNEKKTTMKIGTKHLMSTKTLKENTFKTEKVQFSNKNTGSTY